MTGADPITRARIDYGDLAERLRQACTLTPGEAERRLIAQTQGSRSFYPTKLTKVESGDLAPTEHDVEAMIVVYRVEEQDDEGNVVQRLRDLNRSLGKDEEAGLEGLTSPADVVARLRELGKTARIRRRRGTAKPVRSLQYQTFEREAVEIRMVYNAIPGLLQGVLDFALSVLLASPLLKPARAAGLAAERVERSRAVIRPDGPLVWIALGEDALYRCSGGDEVLLEELEYLDWAANLVNVRFRVILREAGNVAALSTPFTWLKTATRELAHVATAERGTYVEVSETFVLLWDNAWNRAATEDESLAILEARITDLKTRVRSSTDDE